MTNENILKSNNDIQLFSDISGIGINGRTKAHVILRYVETFSDGTERELDSVGIIKPVVFIFKHAGYVNVRLDFGSAKDYDLKYFWKILEEYSNPFNSVSYLPDELESGKYFDGENERLVYFPVIQLALSPIGKESEYQMIGFNPAFYTLQPRDPETGTPCVLQLTFDEDMFIITEDLEPIDMAALQQEVYQLLSEETYQNNITKD